jgi:hypothetical protein
MWHLQRTSFSYPAILSTERQQEPATVSRSAGQGDKSPRYSARQGRYLHETKSRRGVFHFRGACAGSGLHGFGNDL